MLSTHRFVKLAWLVTIVAVGLISFAACGGGSDRSSGNTPGASSDVKVTLKEWMLTPDKTTVAAGPVTFVASNAGTVEHEMVLIKTDLAPDALKLSGDKVDEEGSGTPEGEIPEFQPGDTKTLTLTLEPGSYVLFCNVPGHYQHGVRAAFTVTGSSTTGRSY